LAMFEGEVEHILDPGAVLVLRPGLRHGGLRDYAPDLRFSWLHFRMKTDRRRGGIEIPLRCMLEDPDRILLQIRRYLDDRIDGRQSPLRAAIDVLAILDELRYQRGDRDSGSALAGRAHEFLVSRAREAISAVDIADHCGCHPDHLGRVYRASFSRTLTEALQHQRVRLFARQLLNDPRSIGQIAADYPFATERHLRACFRRQLGVTPTAFRRRHALGIITTF
jgi:AraC-like DNA-binding protein